MEDKKMAEEEAAALGFSKVSELKRAVTERIQGYVANGGFLFAMCSATDSYDVARAAHQTDVCAAVFDGDPADPDASLGHIQPSYGADTAPPTTELAHAQALKKEVQNPPGATAPRWRWLGWVVLPPIRRAGL
jgi:hypothetical protein